MDIIIKCDPDFEGADSVSCAFLEDDKNEKKSILDNKINISSSENQNFTNKADKKLFSVPENIVSHKELSSTAKKSLLNHFKQFGCSKETVENLTSCNSANTQLALEYFKKAAEDAQDFVYQECDSLSFNNITEWLKYFKAMGGPNECNYEAAIILNAIANNEYHPEPEMMNGIDLKAIYRFISYALLGLPQSQLDAASAKFLSSEFQNLIDEANTDEGDIDVRNMKRKIEDAQGNKSEGKIISESLSIDPLNIAGWNFKKVNK